jgi:hypothetical protein
MAIRITRIDDIDGSDGAEAIGFELDHRAYEIDLCARNRIRFLRAIGPFIDRARLIDDGEDMSATATIVRRVSDNSPDPSDGALGDDSALDEESGTLDLIQMARQVQA